MNDSLPFDLLDTFVRVMEHDGHAGHAAQSLQISQPSMSKRMGLLRELGTSRSGEPWLMLKGKRWHLTEAGRKVYGSVEDLVQRHRKLAKFVESTAQETPVVSIGCGQEAAKTIIPGVIQAFRAKHPEIRITVVTTRGGERIEGVASGRFDLAIVTNNVESIHEIAGIELYVEELFKEHMVVCANPPKSADWREAWLSLPTDAPLKAGDLINLPLILQESNADRRKQFDQRYLKATKQLPMPMIEIGGWNNIAHLAELGLGVGLVSESTITHRTTHPATAASGTTIGSHPKKPSLTSHGLDFRKLNPKEFPAEAVRLIARKAHGKNEPSLNDFAKVLHGIIRDVGKSFA